MMRRAADEKTMAEETEEKEIESERAEIIREDKRPASQHVTFVLEEGNVQEQHAVQNEETQKSDFLSFRTIEDYDRAMKLSKTKTETEKNDNQPLEQPSVRRHPEEVSSVKNIEKNAFDDSDSDEDDVMTGTPAVKRTSPPSLSPLYGGIDDLEDMVEAELAPRDSLEGVSPLGPASPASPAPFNNTFFEEEPSEDSLDNIATPSGAMRDLGEEETLEEITERMMSSSEDEDVVMIKPRDLSRTVDSLAETVSSTQVSTPRPPPLIVIIHYVMFTSDAYFVLEDDVGQVFVEYKLLNVDPADTETPGSVKVAPDTKLFFNFRKTFFIEKGTEDWRMLNDIVHNSADKTMTFTVVSDPGESTDAECFNLCKASVDLPTTTDLIECELPLYGARGGDQVGVASVTIETTKAIQALSTGQE